MSNKSNHVEYRGWRVRVETALGFYVLDLLVSATVFGGLALAIPRFQGFLLGALVVTVNGRAALVAYLAVRHRPALLGTHPENDVRRNSAKKKPPAT
jgi:hypothetical protein